MHIEGDVEINVDQQTLWSALHDTGLLERCVPGCKNLEWVDDTSLQARLALQVAGYRKNYTGTIRIIDPHPPQGYTLLLGEHGTGSSVKSRIRLCPSPEGTRLCYSVEAALDTYLTRLGTQVATAIARRLATRFCKRLNTILRERQASPSNV